MVSDKEGWVGYPAKIRLNGIGWDTKLHNAF